MQGYCTGRRFVSHLSFVNGAPISPTYANYVGQMLPMSHIIALGRRRNDMHGRSHKSSSVDDLVSLHNLLEADRAMTAEEKNSATYEGPLVDGAKVDWNRLSQALV